MKILILGGYGVFGGRLVRLLADLPMHEFFNRDLLPALCPQAHLFVQGESW